MKWADALRVSLGLGDRRLTLAEERQAVRVPCSVPVAVRTAPLNVLHGHMVDVSASGMRLDLPQSIGSARKLDILLRGRGGPGPVPGGVRLLRELHVQGDVVWTRRERENNSYQVGVRAHTLRGSGGEEMVAFLRSELAVNVFEDEQRRQFRRFHVPWRLEILAGSAAGVRGSIRDISVCGLLFVTGQPYQVNQVVTCVILADTASVRIHAQAVVRRCVMESHQLGWEMAVAFTHISDRDRNELAEALQRYLRKLPRGTVL